MDVSPYCAGTIGPIETLGYPSLPTKTPGGDEPSIVAVEMPPLVLTID
jgi:hypothetical protein